MRRVTFWAAVAGMSIIASNIVWPAVVNKLPSPGLRALSNFKNVC
jgi:hypothetical protein